jgi:multidrug efflux pump subunit AcrB
VTPQLGTEAVPDANAPTGTRVEETERLSLKALDIVRREAGPANVVITSGFIGVQPPSYPVNLIHRFTGGPQEALIQVALKPAAPHGEALRERIRTALRRELPGAPVSFEAADIVSQVMSFGSPTPVKIAVQGPTLPDDAAYAEKLRAKLATLTFLRDLQFAQPLNYPALDIMIDRERAGQFGLTMADVARSVVPATSSSRFIEPNYWRDPRSGNAFQIQVQIPQNRMQSIEAMGALPVMRDGRTQPQLDQIATLKYGTMPGLIERYNGQRVVSLTANIHGLTLGEAAARLGRALGEVGAPPKGVSVKLRGQLPALEETMRGLRTGLLLTVAAIFLLLMANFQSLRLPLAILLTVAAIFLLLMANFQSLRLPLAILLTVPAVLCGVVVALLVTGTSLNVQSFMGGIMAAGIAVANSILLVTFAEHERVAGRPLFEATREGAASRLRAILMTAAAMTAGMIPMAAGLGEGGAQAAPLGRAFIGGLPAATLATLTVLPAIYAILQGRAATTSNSLNPLDQASRYYVAN